MTDFRALCAELIDALDKSQRPYGDKPESSLVWKARAALAQPEPQGPTDEELNSKPSPNNLQIRSSDLDVTIALVQQWTDEIYGGPGAVVGSDDICLAKLAAQYGADQELEACCEWMAEETPISYINALRAARRPKPATLKEQSLKHLEVMERDGHYLPEILQDLRRALEQLPDNE
jgi:hypothetical protein